MNLKLNYLTIILVLSISVSKAQIDWQSSDWAYACDFNGGDITTVQTNPGNCGPACSALSECTHFTWTTLNGGTCYLKSGKVKKSDAILTEDNSMICSLSASKIEFLILSLIRKAYISSSFYIVLIIINNDYLN
jgi:hypothetical protein